MKTHHDNIWRYLHGELSGQEKTLFERALQTDELLRQALEEKKKMDAGLRAVGAENDNEKLIDVLLEKWEAEHPEYREQTSISREKIIRLGIPLAAAAAAAFVLVSSPWRSGNIHWQKSRYGTGPQFRNSVPGTALYSQSDLKRIDRIIRHKIDKEFSSLNMNGIKWSLQLQLQEAAEGCILVEISGHADSRPEISASWNADFQSLENLEAEASSWAWKVASDLAEPRTP